MMQKNDYFNTAIYRRKNNYTVVEMGDRTKRANLTGKKNKWSRKLSLRVARI